LNRKAFALVAAAGFIVGSAAPSIAAGRAVDPGVCGLASDTPVLASFVASPARVIWQRLPALARSPELEEVVGEAFVLVLGDVKAPRAAGGAGAAAPGVLQNAVCVLLPDGPVLYYNVSRQGFRAQ
jgi:hypothetical protein